MNFESLRSKIAKGQNVLGVMIQDHCSPIIIPILEECGYDFVVVDQEHGPTDIKDLQNLVLAAQSKKIAILVRPPSISYENIAKTLDMSVDGLMVPHVDTVEEAKQIIEYAKYAPLGKRGYGMRQVLPKFCPCKNKEDYIQKANNNTTILVQVESSVSVENIEGILADKYIDGVVVGPSDFTLELGIIGQFEHEKLVKLLDRVLEVCKKNTKGFGIHFGDLDLIDTWKAKGMSILMYSSVSGLIKDGANSAISRLKGENDTKKKTEGSPY
jgi:2-keto-3-deoxy-L-rhamnonate aldolase RhmA